jgi:hypothetical protein
VSCADFPTWDAANRWFWTYHRYGDPAGLDRDANNIPCESLPGAPSAPVIPPDLFKLAPGGALVLPVAGGAAGVPAGVTALVANVTASEASAPGFVSVVPTGAPPTVASNLNLEAAGQTIANLVIVPVAADGTVTLYSQSGTHLIVDVIGYFTGATGSPSINGLFVPALPLRILDTRDPGRLATYGPIPPGGTIEVAPGAYGGLPAVGVGAEMLNVTITESVRAGYAQVYPTGAGVPGSSSTVNVDAAGATRANATITGVTETGGPGPSFSVFDYAGGHLVADYAGYFTTASPASVLDGLEIAPASSPVPYNRAEWGDWTDGDLNCRDTRTEILIEQALAGTLTLSPDGCTVTGGQWVDPYTGQTVTGLANVEIDHMVPLANAHRSRAYAWDAYMKSSYYNDSVDPDHLVVVAATTTQSKGDQGPEAWKPPDTSDWCRYASDWALIKKRWGLTVTQAEYDALASMLGTCSVA